MRVCISHLLVEPRRTEVCDNRACGGCGYLMLCDAPNLLSDRGITHLDWLTNKHDRVAAAC
jgi:hypothetical protein